MIVCFPQDVLNLGCAVVRAFPLYSAKTVSVFAVKAVQDSAHLLPGTPNRDTRTTADTNESRVIVEFIVIPNISASAGVLGALQAAVRSGFDQELYAVLCIAENSMSADATRPDDIIYSYSGKSIEINNTDVEGPLVLADGVRSL
ncbi:putative aminopeptidase NPEPL1 [Hypsibius exemplaris]|uniref:Aminopeptidase NPEPL1 n=1 Tax=Hypsibius exemplaris TaxID=2072580 RepID=A0A1W0WZ34_HYPEX|nr:putative aminopeptidase NPEPL1 [Hypsibius exemplaris]